MDYAQLIGHVPEAGEEPAWDELRAFFQDLHKLELTPRGGARGNT